MKKRIFLLIPAIIAVTGCSKSNAPSFERHSNVVTYEAFKFGVEDYKFAEYLSFASSCKGKVYYGFNYESSAVIDDVTITQQEGVDERELTFGFDKENNRSNIKEKGESSYVGTGAEVDEQRVSKTTFSTQFQYNDKLESFILIDLKEKTYKKYDNKNVTDSILFAIDDEYVIFQSLYKQYDSLDDDTKARYGFYMDGSVFTMTYQFSEEKDVIGGEKAEVVAKSKSSYDYLYQFEIQDGKFQFKSKCNALIEDTYLAGFSGHLKDEIDKNSTSTTCSLEIGPSTSVIKEIDITNYTSLDKDPEGGLLA